MLGRSQSEIQLQEVHARYVTALLCFYKETQPHFMAVGTSYGGLNISLAGGPVVFSSGFVSATRQRYDVCVRCT